MSPIGVHVANAVSEARKSMRFQGMGSHDVRYSEQDSQCGLNIEHCKHSTLSIVRWRVTQNGRSWFLWVFIACHCL